MQPVDPMTPLFRSRLDAGEDLYFRSPLGRPEPSDATLLVASDGAVEVAWPWAYLCGLRTRRLDPGALPDTMAALSGQAVAVVDDGLLAPDAVVGLLRLALASGARQVLLVAPAVSGAVRRACRGLLLHRIVTLRPSTHADLVDRLYPQRPVKPAVARVLLAEVRDAVLQDESAEPGLADQQPDRPPLHLVAK